MKSSIITVTLLGLCAWLGWAAYGLTQEPVPSAGNRARDTSAVSAQRQEKPAPKKTAIAFPPLETLDDMVSRPLFNVSRRPIEAEKPAPDAQPTELNIMLSGIVIGHSGQIAHLRSVTDKQTQALRVGDKIGDWQIQSIFPDRVVLQSGGRVETLFMQKPGAGNAASGRPGVAGAKPTSRSSTDRPRRSPRRNYRRNRRGSTR